jgi:hypothetical protein
MFMPNRTTKDERDKFDHSTHPVSNATRDDLKAPGGGASQRPIQEKENQLQPPPDDQDRINDFFSRHGGAGKTPQRFGGPQDGRQGWSEIEAGDGHVLRCDWSRMGSREEITYSEVAPTGEVPTGVASTGVASTEIAPTPLQK